MENPTMKNPGSFTHPTITAARPKRRGDGPIFRMQLLDCSGRMVSTDFCTKLWNEMVCVFLNKVQANKNELNDVKCKWHPLLLGSHDLGEQKGKWKSENMSLSTIDTRSWPRIQLFGGLSLEVDMANAKSLESCPLFSYESHRNSRRFKSCHMISLAQRIWHVVKTTISRWVLWKSRNIGGVAF